VCVCVCMYVAIEKKRTPLGASSVEEYTHTIRGTWLLSYRSCVMVSPSALSCKPHRNRASHVSRFAQTHTDPGTAEQCHQLTREHANSTLIALASSARASLSRPVRSVRRASRSRRSAVRCSSCSSQSLVRSDQGHNELIDQG